MEKDKTDKGEKFTINYDIEGQLSNTYTPPVESFTVSYDSSIGGDVTTQGIDFSADAMQPNFNFADFEHKPFENCVPSLQEIRNMCEEYPSLKTAYNKFLNVWRMVYDDYKSKYDRE